MGPGSEPDNGEDSDGQETVSRRPDATLRPASESWYQALEASDTPYRSHRARPPPPTEMVQTRARARQAHGGSVDRPNYDVRYHSDESTDNGDDGYDDGPKKSEEHYETDAPKFQPEGFMIFNQAPGDPQVAPSQSAFQPQAPFVGASSQASSFGSYNPNAVPQISSAPTGNGFANRNMNSNLFAIPDAVKGSKSTPVPTYYGVNPSHISVPPNSQLPLSSSVPNEEQRIQIHHPATTNTLRVTQANDMQNALLNTGVISGSQASKLENERPATENMGSGNQSTGTQSDCLPEQARRRRRRRDTNTLPRIAGHNAAASHSSWGSSGKEPGEFSEASGAFDLSKGFDQIGQPPSGPSILTNPNQLRGMNIPFRPVLTNPNQLLGQNFNQPWNASVGSRPALLDSSIANPFEQAAYGQSALPIAPPGSSWPQPRSNGPFGAAGFLDGPNIDQNSITRGQQSSSFGQAVQPYSDTTGRTDQASQPRRPVVPLREDGKPLFYPWPVVQSINQGSWVQDPSQSPVMNQDRIRITPANQQVSILSNVRATLSLPDFKAFPRETSNYPLDYAFWTERHSMVVIMWQLYAANELAKAGVDALFVIHRKSLIEVNPSHPRDRRVRFLAIWVQTPDAACWVTEAGAIYDVSDKKLVDMKQLFEESFPDVEGLHSLHAQVQADLFANLPVIRPARLHAAPGTNEDQGLRYDHASRNLQGGFHAPAAPGAFGGYGTAFTGNAAPHSGQSHGVVQATPQSTVGPTFNPVQFGGQFGGEGASGGHGPQADAPSSFGAGTHQNWQGQAGQTDNFSFMDPTSMQGPLPGAPSASNAPGSFGSDDVTGAPGAFDGSGFSQ